MSLSASQLKKITVPYFFGSTPNWGTVFGNCKIGVVTVKDIIDSYLSIYGSSSITTDDTLSGNGSSASPLGLAQQSATSGQVLQWSGSAWAPATIAGTIQNLGFSAPNITITGGTSLNISSLISSDSPNLLGIGTDSAFKVTVTKDATISGDGTVGSPLTLAQQGATSGQVLQWNGSAWVPNSISGSLPAGATGQLLRYNGSAWVASTQRRDDQTGLTTANVTLPTVPASAPAPLVFLNGILAEPGASKDYTISSNTITFTFSLIVSDKVTTIYYE